MEKTILGALLCGVAVYAFLTGFGMIFRKSPTQSKPIPRTPTIEDWYYDPDFMEIIKPLISYSLNFHSRPIRISYCIDKKNKSHNLLYTYNGKVYWKWSIPVSPYKEGNIAAARRFYEIVSLDLQDAQFGISQRDKWDTDPLFKEQMNRFSQDNELPKISYDRDKNKYIATEQDAADPINLNPTP